MTLGKKQKRCEDMRMSLHLFKAASNKKREGLRYLLNLLRF